MVESRQMFVTPSEVVKRDGKWQKLDTFRIFNAISKARDEISGSELTDRVIWDLVPHILVEASQRTPEAEPISVETIQDAVEKCLVQHGFFTESRAYIRYRHGREIARNSTDDIFATIAEIVDGVNEEALQENANKNPLELSTQRDYIAGTLSRAYTSNFILSKRCRDAHQSGRVHFHDSDYAIQRSHNCELIDLQDIFANGTVINKTKIETPHTFLTACTIASQIDACVASSSYGGQTISIAHLVPFVEKSRQRYRDEVREELLGTEWHYEVSTEELEREVNRIAERRVMREINAGVQTIHYQLNSIATSNGQTPFVTLFMDLMELPENQREDGAKVFAEIFRQRKQGTKNENGAWVSPAFPKLVYGLSELNCREDTPYWWLTVLGAECTARRMVPDYWSDKILYQWKYKGKLLPIRERRDAWGNENIWGKNPFTGVSDGDCDVLDLYALDECAIHYEGEKSQLSQEQRVRAESLIARYNIPYYKVVPPTYAPMGCRSALTPDFIHYKYWGRFNQGVCTINLPYTAMLAMRDAKGKSQDERIKAFWNRMEETLDIVHESLQARHKRLRGTKVEAAPLLWRYGALARFPAGAVIDPLLFDNYSTISVGYAGLYECVYALTGKSHSDPETRKFAFEVMDCMNDHCAKWRKEENISYSLYGTPIESTTYKFAKALRNDFPDLAEIPEVDEIFSHDYVTNSSHLPVREHINIFDKFSVEAEFQRLSPGGAVNYGECVHMEDNIPAVLEIIKFLYDTILYGELNTKSDFCLECGYDKEIPLVKRDDGKWEFRCPNCGNNNPTRMSTARRVCGYVSSNDFNQGRKDEMADRFVHLGGDVDEETPVISAIPYIRNPCGCC